MSEEFINQGGEVSQNKPEEKQEVFNDETMSLKIIEIKALLEKGKKASEEYELDQIDEEICANFKYLVQSFDDLKLKNDINYYSYNFIHGLEIIKDLSNALYLYKAADLAREFLDSRIDEIGQGIEMLSDDSYLANKGLGILLYCFESNIQPEKSSTQITKNFDYIIEELKTSSVSAVFIPAILSQNNPDQRQKITEVIRGQLGPLSDKTHEGYVSVYLMLVSADTQTHELGHEIIDPKFAKYGLDPKTFLDYWQMSDDPDSFFQRLEWNFSHLVYLELVRPGISKVLFDNFGITDYGRYPAEVLIKQFDTIESQKPYGIILYPKHDHNGAFYGDKQIIDDLFEQLGDDYLLRVLESSNASNVLKSLLRLNHKYGDNNKIQFAIVGGHGTKDSIQFGDNEENESVLTNDLIGEAIKKPGRFFVEDPTIILVSCSTGENQGIGQKLSEVFKAHVFAPDKPTSLKGISASVINNELTFDVQYGDEGSTNQYLEGERAGHIDL